MPNLRPRHRTTIMAGVLALALGTTALTVLPGAAQTTPEAPAIALPRAVGPDFADIAARVGPSVVRVLATERVTQARAPAPAPEAGPGSPMDEMLRRFGGRQGPQQREEQAPRRGGQGSGFIIHADGYIVTNAHVVGTNAEVRVELADGREMPARVVGRDAATDIALLKVEAGSPLPALAFGDSDRTRVGEWVMAMGNPFGLGGSVTAGIVSARGRQIGAGPYDDFIQTDAPINPGNSGGPLFNMAGEVVGVNTAIYSPSGGNIGIGFAVPSKMVTHIVGQLREHGRVERGWLGVSLQPMDRDLAQAMQAGEERGALVSGVEANGPAAKAGIQAGDVITAIEGRRIQSPRDLATGVAEARPGRPVTVTLLRAGQSMERRVEIGTNPANRDGGKPADEATRPALGLGLAPRREGGVSIARVEPGSVAAERGLRPGDVILRVGDRETAQPGDVVEAVNAARNAGRPSIALQIERDQARSFIALPLRAA